MAKWICVLEDDDDIRDIITFLLNDGTYIVSGYASVSEFTARSEATVPDLFLLDVLLPDGNGIDVCKVLKSNFLTQSVPVLIMSAHASKSEIYHSCKADGFIAKPFDIDYLLHKVSSALK